MKPLIGVTAGRIYNKDRPYSPYVYGQMHTYTEAIEAAGGVPVILPLVHDDTADDLFGRLDGVLLAGGNDIAPKFYDQETQYAEHTDEARDTFELSLLAYAAEHRMPVLGICRGMQLMNIIRGGTLYQDLKQERPRSHNHDGYLEVEDTEHLAHTLQIMEGTQLHEVLGRATIRSNTHHHQAIRELGTGLAVNCYAEDDVIEGIEDTSGPLFLGVQCHPESLFKTVQVEWLPFFQKLITESTDYASKRN